MSDLPVPKYAIGQTVFFATTMPSSEDHECPDCLGTGRWDLKAPSGYESHLNCPRCQGQRRLKLHSVQAHVPKITIASVRIDTAPRDRNDPRDEPVTYMTTTSGSGTVYRESRLFVDEADARKTAELLALKARQRLDESNSDRDRDRAFFHLSMSDAAVKKAEDAKYKAESRLRRLLERICELDKYPVVGGRYKENDQALGTSLTDEQVKIVQESLVWLDDDNADFLDEWRRDAGGDL